MGKVTRVHVAELESIANEAYLTLKTAMHAQEDKTRKAPADAYATLYAKLAKVTQDPHFHRIGQKIDERLDRYIIQYMLGKYAANALPLRNSSQYLSYPKVEEIKRAMENKEVAFLAHAMALEKLVRANRIDDAIIIMDYARELHPIVGW